METKNRKCHPILFSTPMVQGIDENRKTQTRRTKGLEVINDNLDNILDLKIITDSDKTWVLIRSNSKGSYKLKCPYHVGDVLWVRETFRAIEQEVGAPRFEYKATEKINLTDKWKPSLFMPKKACRTFLKIKSIRVERLQDISEEDAIAEGVYKHVDGGFMNYLFTAGHVCAQVSFESLWMKINGRDSWNKNPFVWVYEFEKIEKPLDFI